MKSPRGRDIESGQYKARSLDPRQYLTVGIVVLSVVVTLSICMLMIVYLPPKSSATGGLRPESSGCPEGPSGPLSTHQVRDMKNFVRYDWPDNYRCGIPLPMASQEDWGNCRLAEKEDCWKIVIDCDVDDYSPHDTAQWTKHWWIAYYSHN